MKTKAFLLSLGLGVVTSVTFTACSDDSSSDSNQVNQIEDNDTDTTEEMVDEVVVEYSVPTPNELFEIISLFGEGYQPNLVNKVDNLDKYIDTKSKALNFGVYSADLAYMSSFEKTADALEYFKIIEKLGDDLGISAAFDESLVNRIQDNQGDADSVFAISSDTYYEAYKYLEENDKGNILALNLAGGWVESMYIITHMVKEFDAEDPLMERLAEQKLVFDNLTGFMNNYSDDQSVMSVLDELVSLLDVFEMYDVIEEDTEVNVDESGNHVISGGITYQINEDAFFALKNKMKELRTNIIE